MPANNNKDTIYVDIDDEITTLIEKVKNSDQRIVALVLPKRASVLQSIVNMKLLKRSADQAKKHVVLITSEAGLLPLAAAVGFYVAKNLQTKPEIPATLGEAGDTVDDAAENDEPIEFSAENASDKPVGELAAAAGTPLAASKADDAIETLQLEDDASEDSDAAAASAATGAATAVPKAKKNRKLAVPNFNRFRMLLALGVLLLALIIVGLYVAAVVLPKGTITISTDTNDVNSHLSLTADTAAQSLDPQNMIVPAQVVQTQKNDSQQVPTTGKKNLGDKATGSVTMTACSLTPVEDVPAGTGISSGGNTYITQNDASFSNTGKFNNGCWQQQSGSVDITAQQAGSQYNVSSAKFTVAGRSDVSATGSADGGTDNIVQVVSQSDIDAATKKISDQNGGSAKQDLANKIRQQGLYPLMVTFNAGQPQTNQSAQVGDQVSTVTVTSTTTYTMFGVKQSNLKTLVDADIKDKIDPSKQTILSEGLDNASFRLVSNSDSKAQLAMDTTATAGPDLQVAAIKKEVAGKKSGEIQDMLKADPGVTGVKVQLSPFWVTKAPSNPAKLTVTFVKAQP